MTAMDVGPSPAPSQALCPQRPTRSPFQRLLREPDWRRLPAAVQARFGRMLAPGDSAAFMGEVAHTRMSRIGWCWAQVARLLGAPLPLRVLARTPAAVIVTEDIEEGVQLWTRIYHEPGRLPQVIRSMKRFDGPSGLEECVGGGVGMTLTLTVEHRCLVFRSDRYFWRAGRFRIPIPTWLTPGRIEVVHREERAGRFSFTLRVEHPWWGRIIEQVAFFRDAL